MLDPVDIGKFRSKSNRDCDPEMLIAVSGASVIIVLRLTNDLYSEKLYHWCLLQYTW